MGGCLWCVCFSFMPRVCKVEERKNEEKEGKSFSSMCHLRSILIWGCFVCGLICRSVTLLYTYPHT